MSVETAFGLDCVSPPAQGVRGERDRPRGGRRQRLPRQRVPRFLRRVQCASGKRAYGSRVQADQVLGHIWSYPRPGRRLECRAYRCHHCWCWHLTHEPLTHRDPRGASR
jgi:hypothetical protein